MSNKFQELVQGMKAQLPGAVATAIFNIADGLVLAVDSNVPDTSQEAMSASHTVIWDKINTFLKLIPQDLVGEMVSMVLEVEGMNFYISVDRNYQLAVMAVSDTTNGNLGLLRVVTKRYLNKSMYLLSNM